MGQDKKGGSLPNKDAFQRMNFLYQAAHHALASNPDNVEMVRFYTHSLKNIAKRKVLRLDPSLKRTMCKRCSMLLVPGVSATVRVRGKGLKRVIVKCVECKLLKRFPLKEGYKLWCEQPEAWIDQDSAKTPQERTVTARPGQDPAKILQEEKLVQAQGPIETQTLLPQLDETNKRQNDTNRDGENGRTNVERGHRDVGES
ncbi:ribonuclease P protein subunit p21 isoform X1 [Lingula anatina]|uniref:Ribonuclease P protein subunit p21 isoform X1 n=2 Tax=Lingula anatina TaxID=7574 RepID=A0A1S3I6R8_LINAN|nr:ribonuclease P protein subunit p21 isoform X1 [Lingula anatina]|eukprot:XP_013393903.1 ribonuclease P protein subunit p21 isoform X1 [Lingula anatina]